MSAIAEKPRTVRRTWDGEPLKPFTIPTRTLATAGVGREWQSAQLSELFVTPEPSRPEPRSLPDRELLLTARAILARRGLVQGSFNDPETGRVCMVGALLEAVGVPYEHLGLGPQWRERAMLTHGAELLFGPHTLVSHICAFNNSHTHRDALERFDRAIERLPVAV